MNIAIGSDHAGLVLKDEIAAQLRDAGHQVQDFGTNSTESTDYPDYAGPVAKAVANGAADRGVLVCASGVGMSIAANKIHGVRAALGTTADEVHFVRAHNDANVLTLGAKYTPAANAAQLVREFLQTPFEGGRHQRRVDKISQLELNS
jgi:ribose 5-phosphate isomerase B